MTDAATRALGRAKELSTTITLALFVLPLGVVAHAAAFAALEEQGAVDFTVVSCAPDAPEHACTCARAARRRAGRARAVASTAASAASV